MLVREIYNSFLPWRTISRVSRRSCDYYCAMLYPKANLSPFSPQAAEDLSMRAEGTKEKTRPS